MRITYALARLAVCSTIAVATAGIAVTSSARADDTGFASIHDLVAVGSKLCMADHSHHGSGDTMPTRKAAELSAIRSWADFTALEYGSDWANYGNAVGKAVSCEPASGGWQCSLDARPCRHGRAGYAASAGGPAKSRPARGQAARKTAEQ